MEHERKNMSVAEPASADDTFIPRPDTQIIQGKGEFVAAGVTSLVERLPNGDIESHHEDISRQDRLRWARQAAEGLQLLHASGVLHWQSAIPRA